MNSTLVKRREGTQSFIYKQIIFFFYNSFVLSTQRGLTPMVACKNDCITTSKLGIVGFSKLINKKKNAAHKASCF